MKVYVCISMLQLQRSGPGYLPKVAVACMYESSDRSCDGGGECAGRFLGQRHCVKMRDWIEHEH